MCNAEPLTEERTIDGGLFIKKYALISDRRVKVAEVASTYFENDDYYHLTRLWVHPFYRNKGIATYFMNELKNQARMQGACFITLCPASYTEPEETDLKSDIKYHYGLTYSQLISFYMKQGAQWTDQYEMFINLRKPG